MSLLLRTAPMVCIVSKYVEAMQTQLRFYVYFFDAIRHFVLD